MAAPVGDLVGDLVGAIVGLGQSQSIGKHELHVALHVAATPSIAHK